MVNLGCRAAVDVERNAEVLERLLDKIVNGYCEFLVYVGVSDA